MNGVISGCVKNGGVLNRWGVNVGFYGIATKTELGRFSLQILLMKQVLKYYTAISKNVVIVNSRYWNRKELWV